jgi:hypothetical protein
MKRRDFEKLVPLSALATSAILSREATASAGRAPTKTTTAQASAGASGSGEAPAWVKSMKDSDMVGLGPDGKPDPNYNANGTGHSLAPVDPTKKPHQMTLTQEERDILNGKKGDAAAEVMKWNAN